MYPLHEVVYALCEHNGGDPFYVGRSIDWLRRAKEHRLDARTGTEAKYQFIRKLWARGSDFELVILEENPGLRYEKYYHYILGCEYTLTNMKMGDAWATEMTAQKHLREQGRSFTNAIEYLSAMDQAIAEEKARKKAARVQARIRSNSSDVERTLYVGENPNTKFISPAMQAIREKENGKTTRPTKSDKHRE